jgi:hypothetical protein
MRAELRRAVTVLLLMLGATLATPAAAQCVDPGVVTVPNGYLTGERLQQLSNSELAGYVVGFINGALFSVVTGSDARCIEQIDLCIAGRSPAALAAAVRRYLALRPDFVVGPAARATWNAIFAECYTEFLAAPPPTPS